jgi:hypothetical protein
MLDALEASAAMLKGLSENDILDVLGCPDVNELYSRNQKFYLYYITPSEECGVTRMAKEIFLEIRFSATNQAREVMIKEAGE